MPKKEVPKPRVQDAIQRNVVIRLIRFIIRENDMVRCILQRFNTLFNETGMTIFLLAAKKEM